MHRNAIRYPFVGWNSFERALTLRERKIPSEIPKTPTLTQNHFISYISLLFLHFWIFLLLAQHNSSLGRNKSNCRPFNLKREKSRRINPLTWAHPEHLKKFTREKNTFFLLAIQLVRFEHRKLHSIICWMIENIDQLWNSAFNKIPSGKRRIISFWFLPSDKTINLLKRKKIKIRHHQRFKYILLRIKT